MAALEARELTKCYLPSVPAVRDLSFCLTEGQVLGFVGPNGSGKSTTVKMLTGLLQPTHGQVLWCGAAIQRDLLQYRKRLGYVPEEIDLYPFLSGWEYNLTVYDTAASHAESLRRTRELGRGWVAAARSTSSPWCSYPIRWGQQIRVPGLQSNKTRDRAQPAPMASSTS